MENRRIPSARRTTETRRPSPFGAGAGAEAARDRAVRAAYLAGLCIAAFECSQLVFRSTDRPFWADANEVMARADAPGTSGAGVLRPLA